MLFVCDQQIKFIERANFKHLENLEQLDLYSNEIEILPEDVFWDLTNLKRLDLSNNKIEELSDKIFMNLKNIQSINLSNNRIKHFPSKLLDENVQLRTFAVVGNPGNTSNIDISKIPKVKFAYF
jgi:Leucine-rich repeat (LRR) protein